MGFVNRVTAKYTVVGNEGFELLLGAGINPDFDRDEQTAIPTKKVKVNSIDDAIDKCMAFQHENDLGGGQWFAGEAGWLLQNGKKVARVAYNGNLIDTKDRLIKRIQTEDGYTFYLLHDGSLVDNLDKNYVDMSYDSLEELKESGVSYKEL